MGTNSHGFNSRFVYRHSKDRLLPFNVSRFVSRFYDDYRTYSQMCDASAEILSQRTLKLYILNIAYKHFHYT